ncbi:hypothetical protein HNQ02_003716 [Flavobacterium sp. 7E]|uniref:hypothetical protein n=1 Tax=unclassified Flavobacterium TaxID=196869 RepID=UPI00156F331A|nr:MULTISPECIES: hypothetical protein [unclassified Flavobacterium]MBE0393655.1 hypothetical protein [Flavobacterium sp. PL002]NRS90769.1 hypothetical protein [Flavobacterium sp. 7E]
MKYSIFIFAIILTLGCTSKHDLKNVTKIYEKLIVFNGEGLVHSENKIIIIDGKRCVIEKKIIYDHQGKCLFLYTGGSEGLISHSRNSSRGYLPIEGEALNYTIKIDKKNNWILDNNDTIRVFKVLGNEIITSTNEKRGRFFVYKYR